MAEQVLEAGIIETKLRGLEIARQTGVSLCNGTASIDLNGL